MDIVLFFFDAPFRYAFFLHDARWRPGRRNGPGDRLYGALGGSRDH